MAYVIYQEKEYPFNADFEYSVKDKEGNDVKHVLNVKLTEDQLSKLDMTDKKASSAVEMMDASKVAKILLSNEQIKALEANTKNSYQYNTIISNMAAHVMGFIQAQRIEEATAAMSANPALKQYQSVVKNTR